MKKALLLYPLGEIDKYEEITYTFNSAKTKTKLPVLWLSEKIGGIEEITFIITKKLQEDYFSLFEKLCEFILKKEIRNVFSDDDIKKFRKRENFNEDKKIFTEKLTKEQESKFNYDFLIIDEENLLSFIHELKLYIESRADYTIHIDITHAYRFIPMFIVIVVSLLKSAGKNIEIGEILYAFAGADENKIISLKDYFDVLNWSNAIYSFKTSASIRSVVEILKNYHAEFSNLLSVLQESLDMNLAPEIKKSLDDLKKKLEVISFNDEIFKQLVLDDLKKVLSEFVLDKSQSDFELSLAKWHLKNRRYLHGYTALIEAIITKVCESYGLDSKKRDIREQAKCICLSIRKENLENHADYKNFVDNYIKNNDKLHDLQKKISIFFEELTNIRNTFAHIKTIDDVESSNIYNKAMNLSETLNPSTLSKKTFSSIDELFEAIKELPTLLSEDKLLNLSEIYKKMKKGG